MSGRTREETISAYRETTHRIGRAASLLTVVLLVGAPFVIGAWLGASPDLAAVGRGFLAAGTVWTVSSVVEFLVYTPMLGSGGGYLAFITGNLINMKIPCAMNARETAGTKTGTIENEIISTISIATSSLVTILVLAAGVLALTPIRPILQSPALAPAFDNVVPALFGALACRYCVKNWRLALVPLTLMSALFVLVPSLMGSVSIMIIPAGGLTIALAYIGFRKRKAANGGSGEAAE